MGVTTARGTYEFRKDHDYRITVHKKQFKSHNPGLTDPDFTYGIQTKFEKIKTFFNFKSIFIFFVDLIIL